MNLKVIHIVFVTSAVLLALFVAGWAMTQTSGYTALGVLSLLAAVGLVVYGFWFWRKITTPEEERERRRRLFRTVPVLAGASWLAAERSAWACSGCYGGLGLADGGGPMLDASRAGAWFLLGSVFLIQGALVLFFLYLRRRARQFQDSDVPPWWSTIEEPVKS